MLQRSHEYRGEEEAEDGEKGIKQCRQNWEKKGAK